MQNQIDKQENRLEPTYRKFQSYTRLTHMMEDSAELSIIVESTLFRRIYEGSSSQPYWNPPDGLF